MLSFSERSTHWSYDTSILPGRGHYHQHTKTAVETRTRDGPKYYAQIRDRLIMEYLQGGFIDTRECRRRYPTISTTLGTKFEQDLRIIIDRLRDGKIYLYSEYHEINPEWRPRLRVLLDLFRVLNLETRLRANPDRIQTQI
jgi:hypothetical protein